MDVFIKGFDWDEANLKKLGKHGVVQEEAEEIFYLSPFVDEGAYEKKKKRYRCLGITSGGRYLAAFFTIRRGFIRNISVRPMRRQERKLYAEKKTT
ncbi:MAG: BrnT family toxin [Deltaproteobacteria bacterium]|nr:BrnT family toxin [Deltaproteobacteria bacterium]